MKIFGGRHFRGASFVHGVNFTHMRTGGNSATNKRKANEDDNESSDDEAAISKQGIP